MFVGGAWLLAAVFGVFVLARLRSGRIEPVVVSTAETFSPALPPRTAAPGYGGWLYFFVVLVLAAIANWSTGSNDKHPPH